MCTAQAFETCWEGVKGRSSPKPHRCELSFAFHKSHSKIKALWPYDWLYQMNYKTIIHRVWFAEVLLNQISAPCHQFYIQLHDCIIKFCFHGNLLTYLLIPLKPVFNILVIFNLWKLNQAKRWLHYACQIMQMRYHWERSKWNTTRAKKPNLSSAN